MHFPAFYLPCTVFCVVVKHFGNLSGFVKGCKDTFDLMFSSFVFCLLLQVTNGFELYLCFSPMATKALAVSAVNKLLKWIRKEEDRLFILSPLTY